MCLYESGLSEKDHHRNMLLTIKTKGDMSSKRKRYQFQNCNYNQVHPKETSRSLIMHYLGLKFHFKLYLRNSKNGIRYWTLYWPACSLRLSRVDWILVIRRFCYRFLLVGHSVIGRGQINSVRKSGLTIIWEFIDTRVTGKCPLSL